MDANQLAQLQTSLVAQAAAMALVETTSEECIKKCVTSYNDDALTRDQKMCLEKCLTSFTEAYGVVTRTITEMAIHEEN